jgi:hypothetical protein
MEEQEEGQAVEQEPVEIGTDEVVETAEQPNHEEDQQSKPEERLFKQDEVSKIVAKEVAKAERKLKRQQEPPQIRPQEPTLDRSQFESEEAYIDAVAEVKAHQKLTIAEQQKVWKAFTDKEVEAEERYPDYMDVTRKMALSDFMLSAVVDEDNAAEVLYHLGTNPKEAAKIAALPPRQQIKEIGKLSARLSIQGEEKPKVSQAPEPIKPIGAKGKVVKAVQDMDDNEFAEHRRKIRAQRGR